MSYHISKTNKGKIIHARKTEHTLVKGKRRKKKKEK